MARVLSILLALAAAAAIWSTARVFSATVDEPAHLAAGMQWLTTDRYDFDINHPPLGRIAAALGPYLAGARRAGTSDLYEEGVRILGTGDRFERMLALARRGELVFFLVLAFATWGLARRVVGETGAALAVFFVASNPNVLAHAGLATTDIAATATTTLALLALLWLVEAPNFARAAVLGLAFGAAFASRFSTIAFLGSAVMATYFVRGGVTRDWTLPKPPRGSRWTAVAIAAVTTLIVLCAVYRLNLPPMADGIRSFLAHGERGHPAFLLGEASVRGWWYYYPVALLVKTPLPLLVLATIGASVAIASVHRREGWVRAVPLAAAIAMLAVSMTVHVDLGVRLVLAVYPLLAVCAAEGVLALWRSTRQRAAAQAASVLLVLWSLTTVVRAHPDHLAYFNALAGPQPERVLVDSNLDWGQDVYRLRDTLAARGVRDTVLIAYFGTALPSATGIIPRSRVLGLRERATGWIAASETYLAGEWVGHAYQWLLAYPPVARIGPSMRLWYIP